MKKKIVHPIVLAILDGWGHTNIQQGNAIKIANTPTIDSLVKTYPNTLLVASGQQVGLPKGQMGNSEVGHTTIGGGRIVQQELLKIGNLIDNNSFFKNQHLNAACQHALDHKTSLHLIGLCSNGGVHSHIDHLLALIDLAESNKVSNLYLHLITDGRDTNPNSAKTFIQTIVDYIQNKQFVVISTISGRYYAMDRDFRWSRTQAVYNVLISGNHSIDKQPKDYTDLINYYYNQGISDEFIPPSRINEGSIQDSDALIFFNFRPDRMRQLVQSFAQKPFKCFTTQSLSNLHVSTFTNYDASLDTSIAFPPSIMNNFLGEVISKYGLKQFRIAETEKYAHVTYFFNGGSEDPFVGEDRELVSSPSVTTYDLTPNMSAELVTQKSILAINKAIYSCVIINYANADMLGHTGKLKETISSIEMVDTCIASLLDAVSKLNGTLIITADHGNAECMFTKDGSPCTSHTTNLVPFILVEGEQETISGHGGTVKFRENGSLADIAPTILDILDLKKPLEMTGNSLILNSRYETRSLNQTFVEY
uniref:2,3-bisphosphoglycerate-independent phosphoglycerate mutase n=1 Tax=Wildemania schizophylla TaxID=1134705 RepID=A0A126G281_WILSC|nr:phosphoglycerate mutase [Wildemania schizophylla]AKS28524.1 phosphoglycerate mutase [Wildemania schizophylla]